MEKFRHLKEYKFVLSILIIIIVMLFILNEVAGFVSLILAGVILFDIANKREELQLRETAQIEKLCENFDSAAQDSVFNMPFPLVLTDDLGNINWYNPPLLKLLGEQDAVGEHIDEIIDGFVFEKLKVNEIRQSEIHVFDANYNLFHNRVEKTDGEVIHIFYFVDNSKYDQLREKYTDRKIGFGHIYIDNYDEIGLGKKGYLKSVIIAEVENKIMEYFTSKDAIVRRYDDDKYIAVFNQVSLRTMINERFSILDIVREIGKQNDSTITLSIGISETLDSIPESYEESRAAVDLALGRGGDQVVVRTKEGHEFFGGRTQAREKRNRVRARVIGNSLANLVEEASEIFIMGHKNADMDSIGSAIGMLGAVRRMEKEGFIVLNEVNPSIKIIMDAMKREALEINEFIIDSDQAIDMAQKSKSLIIMLDNHKIYMAEEPRLFNMVDKVVVIDHHRRGNDGIENAVLSYIESYASSTSELVTEILEYMDPDMNITTFEAEAMMAGIVVDTKNFTFQTGVRTFEAASILRRNGANPIKVNKFFHEDLDTVRSRAKVVHDADIVRDEIAIAKLDEEGNSNVLIAAQAADSLLNIVGVNASFVLVHKEDYIHISGRSTGEISVQLILEKLGGGGHLVSAATQVYNVTMEEAYNKLLQAIDIYYEEIEKKENTDEDNIIEGS
ncbi:MAG: phosphoesterase [Tissierellia bacterium]|nr:phosphoesterase [Tissierellia bacterium]